MDASIDSDGDVNAAEDAVAEAARQKAAIATPPRDVSAARSRLSRTISIRFARATAHTAYGTCGVKVWIFNGEVLEAPKAAAAGASVN